ncbi:uncharacterized protein A4U43_C02F18000, partial [Asparagus officinalis]
MRTGLTFEDRRLDFPVASTSLKEAARRRTNRGFEWPNRREKEGILGHEENGGRGREKWGERGRKETMVGMPLPPSLPLSLSIENYDEDLGVVYFFGVS